MKLRLPQHWSEWALAVMVVLLTVKVMQWAAFEWHMLQRNGGFWFAIKGLFGD